MTKGILLVVTLFSLFAQADLQTDYKQFQENFASASARTVQEKMKYLDETIDPQLIKNSISCKGSDFSLQCTIGSVSWKGQHATYKLMPYACIGGSSMPDRNCSSFYELSIHRNSEQRYDRYGNIAECAYKYSYWESSNFSEPTASRGIAVYNAITNVYLNAIALTPWTSLPAESHEPGKCH